MQTLVKVRGTVRCVRIASAERGTASEECGEQKKLLAMTRRSEAVALLESLNGNF